MDSTDHINRIVFVDHTAALGGGEIALLNLVQHLDPLHYHPIVVLGSEGGLRARLEEAGIETHLLPLSSDVVQARKDSLGVRSLLRVGAIANSLRYVRRLARRLRELNADLVHTNSLKSDLLGGFAARLIRLPLVWHVRDRIDDDYLPWPVVRTFRWLCRWVPDFVIANSGATLETLHLPKAVQSRTIYSGIVTGRSRVMHDGVQTTEPPCPEPAQTSEPLIGIVGRISPWKGQHLFIEAAAAVRKAYPDARFQIIGSAMFGEDAYEKQIRAQVVSLGLQDCLEFTGFCTDVPDRIQQLTVLVHASTSGEPFGQVVIEGMAACKPVIATRGGGVVEIVEEGVTGLLVPMNDAPALANALLRLLGDPVAARAMGIAGYRRAQEKFSIERTVELVQSVYHELLNRPGTGRKPLVR